MASCRLDGDLGEPVVVERLLQHVKRRRLPARLRDTIDYCAHALLHNTCVAMCNRTTRCAVAPVLVDIMTLVEEENDIGNIDAKSFHRLLDARTFILWWFPIPRHINKVLVRRVIANKVAVQQCRRCLRLLLHERVLRHWW